MASAFQRNGALAYQRAQTETASPTHLVVMLYDGAIRFLTAARDQIGGKDIEARHTNLVKAQRIIGELLGSLDKERGGEVAANLSRLYVYMLNELVEANLFDSAQKIEGVLGILRELRESWAALDQQARRGDRESGHA